MLQVASDRDRVLLGGFWLVSDNVVELFEAGNGDRDVAGWIYGDAGGRVVVRDGRGGDFSYAGILLERGGPQALPPGKHCRRLQHFNVLMQVCRKTVASSSDDVLLALDMLPHVVFL